MHARTPDEAARVWRERIAGRLPRDPDAALVAIRQAYRQSGLAPPASVLWVDGPSEAVQAVAFLRTPPRVLWRFAAVLAVLGAMVWLGLALVVSKRLVPLPANGDFIAFATMLGAFVIVLGSLRPVPVAPKLPGRARRGEVVAWLAALVIITLQPLCCTALLYLGGIDLETPALAGVLLLAAAFGSLPGLLLAARVHAVERQLPEALRHIGPAVPVGCQLQRARDSAWAPFRQQILFASWSDRLPAQGRRDAHAIAFRDESAGVFAPDAVRRARDARTGGSGHLISDWLSRVFEPTPMLDAPLHHLDGIEDATRAAAIECTSAGEAALCFTRIAFHLDRLYAFRGIAVAVWPATRATVDGEERLHGANGPALTWEDGTAVYVWHGRLVDADLIEDGTPLTLGRIGLERDPNRRRVLIERFGLGRYMLESGAVEIQHDRCGGLYRLEQRLDEPIIAVRVINHTPHPDGSFEEFWLRVPPSTRTAREAVAWTFGLSPDEYEPALQS